MVSYVVQSYAGNRNLLFRKTDGTVITFSVRWGSAIISSRTSDREHFAPIYYIDTSILLYTENEGNKKKITFFFSAKDENV